jgi:hypothetical protein
LQVLLRLVIKFIELVRVQQQRLAQLLVLPLVLLLGHGPDFKLLLP